MMIKEEFASNVILVDVDYLEKVAFDLIVNFERMLNRPIAKADLAQWLDCIALDGGLRPGENKFQVFFLHSAEQKAFRNFLPADFEKDINGKAFKDNLGEFMLNAFPVEELVTPERFFIEAMEVLVKAEKIERLMVIGNMETQMNEIKHVAQSAEGKEITLFAMEPISGRHFYSEILGYSLMNAMGVHGDEFK